MFAREIMIIFVGSNNNINSYNNKLLFAFLILLLLIQQRLSKVTTLSYTGGQQTYKTGACTNQLDILACGAVGGSWLNSGGATAANGGNGGCITATVSVSSLQTLYVFVGGAGGTGRNSPVVHGGGGYNGGASGRLFI